MITNKIEEVPINVDDLQESSTVVIADYSTLPPRYSMGRVASISDNKQVITVGALRFSGDDGWRFTSSKTKKYEKRLLQLNDALIVKIHRDQLIANLSNVIWALENTIVLEAVWNTYNAGRAVDVEE